METRKDLKVPLLLGWSLEQPPFFIFYFLIGRVLHRSILTQVAVKPQDEGPFLD